LMGSIADENWRRAAASSEAEVAVLRASASDAWAQVEAVERRCRAALEGEAEARREVARMAEKLARLETWTAEAERRHEVDEERLVASLDSLVASHQGMPTGEVQDALARQMAASELDARQAQEKLEHMRQVRNELRVELKEALEEVGREKRSLEEERARAKALGESLRDELSTALLEKRQLAKQLERLTGDGQGAGQEESALEAELAEARAAFGHEVGEKDRKLREARERGVTLETKAKAMVDQVAERIAVLESQVAEARREAEMERQRAADAEKNAQERWVMGSPALGRQSSSSSLPPPEPVASPARQASAPRLPPSSTSSPAQSPYPRQQEPLSPRSPGSPPSTPLSDTERLDALVQAVEVERTLRAEVESVRARELKTEQNMSMALEALAHETEVELSLRSYIAELEAEMVELRHGLGRITQHRSRETAIQKLREGAAGVLGALAGFAGLALAQGGRTRRSSSFDDDDDDGDVDE